MFRIKRMLAVLLSVVMLFGILPIMTSASTSTTGGIVTTKDYDAGTGMLRLEAYATGESQIMYSVKPIDVVLVLDVSGSMSDEITSYAYTETYNISNNGTYYYKDSNDEFRRAYYCDGGSGWFCSSGWFTREHGFGSHGGSSLTPKTSADSAGTQFYTRTETTVSKLNALKTAAKNFVDLVAANSAESNIAIVKFAGNNTSAVGNDKYNRNTYNYSQIVRPLTSASGADGLKNAIDALTAGGATQADYGMAHAKTILEGSTNTEHEKVVVMFTDGEPTSTNGFETEVANAAINTGAQLKSAGVTVYTIGCFGDADPSELADEAAWSRLNNINKYMNLVSSNFNSSATSMSASFSNYSYGSYYKAASSSDELNSVFSTIASTIGGTEVTLTETAVLKDVVSDYFEIPEGAEVKAHTETCVAIDDNGDPTAWSNDNNNLTVNVSGKIVTVTGFDYSANWVGSHNGIAGGKKVVLELQIRDNGTGFGSGIPTNGEGAGIYANASATEPAATFTSPTIDFPYYTVVKVRGTEVGAPTNVRLSDAAPLTSYVESGYLYGGAFNNADCTEVYPFANGETGYNFTPVNGATYYIKEVDNNYLRPKLLTLWHTNSNGRRDVNGAYFVTVIDSVNYREVGFESAASDLGDVEFDLAKKTTLGSTDVFESIKLTRKNGAERTYVPSEFYSGEISSGLLACRAIDKASWQNANDIITYTPYWVTLDGVKVYGVKTRTVEYLGEGYENFELVGDVDNTLAPLAQAVQPVMAPLKAAPLRLRSSFVSDGSEFDVNSVTPPAEEDPFIPVIPEKKTCTVTVHDNGEVYEVEVAKNEDVELVYSGSVFAGWFTDEDCTVPADLSNITSDIDVYAKYVSDDYLCVKYIEIGWLKTYEMTLISAIDGGLYEDTGFVVNGEKISSSYTSRYGTFTARALFGKGISSKAKLMTYSMSLRGASKGDRFEVTPYWVTLDGTTVYGTSRTFTYGSRGISVTKG